MSAGPKATVSLSISEGRLAARPGPKWWRLLADFIAVHQDRRAAAPAGESKFLLVVEPERICHFNHNYWQVNYATLALGISLIVATVRRARRRRPDYGLVRLAKSDQVGGLLASIQLR